MKTTYIPSQSRRYILFLALLVSFLTILVYLPSLGNGFINWDDNEYVYNNAHIRSFGLPLLRWSFTAFYSFNWHPLSWLSHALDYALWGLNPTGHHLTSVILHGLNAFLVVILVFELISLRAGATLAPESSAQESRLLQLPIFASLLTGLLFGLHPLHVESVVWVSERKDVLCAFFFLLSLLSYLRFAAAPRGSAKTAYCLSLLFFMMALMSKPMAVTLPVVLLILDYFPLARLNRNISSTANRRIWIEKIPFFALSLLSVALTLIAQQKAMPSLELFPFGLRILVALRAVGFYLAKMIYPVNLVPLYPYPKEISLLSADVFFPYLIAAAFTGYSFWTWLRKGKLWPAVWLYYVITLLPVLGIIQVGEQAAADRYTYLPSLGPFLLAGLGLTSLLHTAAVEKRGAAAKSAAGILLLLLILLPTSLLTVKQEGFWKDPLTLWDRELQVYPDNYRAYFTRGNYYYEKGMYREALANFNRTIELYPRLARAYYDRGMVYEDLGNDRQALSDYTKSIEYKPDYQPAYNNRGILYGRTGRYDKALEDFDMAVRLNGRDALAYFNRGLAYRMLGDEAKAAADFRAAAGLGESRALDLLRGNAPANLQEEKRR